MIQSCSGGAARAHTGKHSEKVGGWGWGGGCSPPAYNSRAPMRALPPKFTLSFSLCRCWRSRSWRSRSLSRSSASWCRVQGAVRRVWGVGYRVQGVRCRRRGGGSIANGEPAWIIIITRLVYHPLSSLKANQPLLLHVLRRSPQRARECERERGKITHTLLKTWNIHTHYTYMHSEK